MSEPFPPPFTTQTVAVRGYGDVKVEGWTDEDGRGRHIIRLTLPLQQGWAGPDGRPWPPHVDMHPDEAIELSGVIIAVAALCRTDAKLRGLDNG